MLKPVKINEETYKSLKTNLIVWIVYSTSNFKIHIADELSGCVNLNIDCGITQFRCMTSKKSFFFHINSQLGRGI